MGLEDINRIKNISERDIDMLLLEEFNVNPEFSSWFLSATFPHRHGSECIGAWHSVSDPEFGESDLIVLYENAFAILIENKIDAPVQPNQGDRYRERGKKGIEKGMWESFGTCMIAPIQYLQDKEDSKIYDSTQSYEGLEEWFAQMAKAEPRALHKRFLMIQAIEQKRRGYTPETDVRATQFWDQYWRFCRENYQELEMKQPGYKPAGSDWPVFRPASLLIPMSRIVHKLAEGFVDLEVSESFVFTEALETRVISLGASIEQTGKSRSVRLRTAPVNRSDGFDTQNREVTEGLRAAKKLLKFAASLTDPNL